jgi:hypothetical protein
MFPSKNLSKACSSCFSSRHKQNACARTHAHADNNPKEDKNKSRARKNEKKREAFAPFLATYFAFQHLPTSKQKESRRKTHKNASKQNQKKNYYDD